MSMELCHTAPTTHHCQHLHLFLKEGKTCICSCWLLPLLLPGTQWLEAILEVLFLLVQTLCPALHVFSNLKCRVVCLHSSSQSYQSLMTSIQSHMQFQNKSTHYLLFLNHGTLDVVQLFPCIQCSKITLLAAFTCTNPSYQANPLSDGSVILPLILAGFHKHSSYAELISALKHCQLHLSSAPHSACKLKACTPLNNLGFPLSWKRSNIIPFHREDFLPVMTQFCFLPVELFYF